MKKPMRSTKAITIRLCAFALVIWIAFTFFITFTTAEYIYSAFVGHHHSFSSHLGMALRYETEVLPARGGDDFYEIMDKQMLDTIALANSNRFWFRQARLSQGGTRDPFSVLRRYSVAELQTAVIFYDSDGNILRQSADILRLWYFTEDGWHAAGDASPEGNAFIILGADKDSARIRAEVEQHNFALDQLRVTGYFVGAEFVPVKFSRISWDALFDARNRFGSYVQANRAINDLVQRGVLEWQVLFDNTAGYDGELVTLYSGGPHLMTRNVGGSIRHGGAAHDDLLAFLLDVGYQDYLHNESMYGWGFISNDLQRMTLREVMAVATWTFQDAPAYDTETGFAASEPDFIMLTAISGSPLRHAMNELRNIYIATFIISALAVLIMRRIIRDNLILPITEVNEGFTRISEGQNQYRYLNCDLAWDEPMRLAQHYEKTTDKLLSNKNEITRLNTALEYAKKAEEDRRQMTSNIAHELKTPLAIIHSYAEGLKEHIAEEKREQYLDVILSESERMDAMVMEMLDLSRLEAGKVSLARDDFSLTELVKEVIQKLDLVIKEKGLEVSFEPDGGCNINADESRICQAVSNLVANAVKYSPAGSAILLRTYTRRGKAWFSAENESEPLTWEHLSKVWDAFYRTDDARSDGGSGLGLTITKSIISLHGGGCFARNTKTGVEFGFNV